MGGDSVFRGCEFESQHCILDGHFFTFICCENFFENTKINEKEAEDGPFLRKKIGHWLKVHSSGLGSTLATTTRAASTTSTTCLCTANLLLRVNSLNQCDQIGRFIALWAIFQSLWQQLILSKSPTFLGNFCKGVKIYHFSSEIIFGQLLWHLAIFFLITLLSA